jgi:adenylate cyclase
VVGVVAIGVSVLLGQETTLDQLAVAMVVLGATGLGFGLLAVVVAARATADPVNSVREAMGRVQQGELDTRVPPYDGTELGQLQLGFNEMAAGLQERS